MLCLALTALAGDDLTDAEFRARQRVKGKTVAAWVYGGESDSTPPAGKRYVAAELRLKRFSDDLVLHNVEAVDPRTDLAFGNPQYVCVAEGGDWMACEGDGEREVTVRFVWTVSASSDKLFFELWGRKLSGRARIDPTGPALPRRQR